MLSRSWIRRLFSQKKPLPFQKAASSQKAAQIPLRIEPLEIRQLLSVSAAFSSGTLTLTESGTTTNATVGHQIVANPPGSDYLLVFDNGAFVSIAGGTPVTVQGGQSTQGVLASNVTAVVYNGGASSAAETLTLNGGTVSGPNTLLPYAGASTLTGGSGTNSLTGGLGNDSISGGTGTNTLTGGPGTNTITGNALSAVTTLKEFSNNSDTTFTLTNTAVSLSGGQLTDNYTNIKVINLTGGSGNDVFDVSSITSSPPTVVLDGGTGTNKITATNDVNFTLAVGTLSRTSLTTVSFSNIQQAALTGGPSDNTFTINDWAGTGTSLTGGGGNDLVISAGFDFALTTLSDGSLTRGNQAITLSGITRASLAGLSGNDEFNLSGWTGAATVAGGSGANNTLDGPNVNSIWNFSSATAGNITAGANNIQFSQIKNFKGGTANDTFNLAQNQPIGGTIDGGGGALNILSYATFTDVVTVNLSGISGVTGMQSIIGGSNSNDVIIGSAHNNAWTINGNNSGFVNDLDTPSNTAFSSFENVTGGGVSDRFNFTSNGAISGSLSGGSGAVSNAILDYTGFSNAVSVALTSGSANGFSGTGTNIGGGFSKVTSLAGSSGNDALTGPNSATTWNLQPSGVDSLTTGGNTFRFSAVENVTGGSANDTFQLPNGPVSTSINGGGGTNVIDYTGFAGNLGVNLQTGANTGVNIQSITGGSGNNTITGANSNNAWTINGANSGFVVWGAGPSNAAFSNFRNIIGGNGASDDFGFSGNGSIGGTLTGRGANETLDYNPAAGSFANSAMVIITSANAAGVNGNASNIGAGFTGISAVIGSANNDTLRVKGTTAQGLDWNVTGNNSGQLTLIGSALPALPFNSFESLVSSAPASGFSTFRFSSPSSALAGTISAGGNDALDYTGYGSPVTVNLNNHSATAIFGGNANGFSGINKFTGSGVGGTFQGSNAGFNTFSMNGVNTGNDSVTGGGFFTFSGFANLIGGSAGNAFNFVNNAAQLTGNITGASNDALSFAGHTSSPLTVTITSSGSSDNTAGGSFVGFSGNTAGSVLGGSFSGIGTLVGTNTGDTLFGLTPGFFLPAGNTFTITGPDSGTYNSFPGKNLNYSQIANLHAGVTPAGDNFLIAGGTVSGSLSGQGTGSSTLSYALESGVPVVVSMTTLRSGTATAVGNGFIGFAHLIGEPSTPLSVTLNGPSNANGYLWRITGNNAGDLNDDANFSFNFFTFSGVANITGSNTKPDRFTFLSNGPGQDFNLSGVVDGGTGPGDFADYSAFVGDLVVALGTKVLNMETLVGGGGSDTLIGAATANLWTISQTNVGTVNGTFFTNFQTLQGNVVSDVFSFILTGSVTGAIIGGGGNPEKLDFSNWSNGNVTFSITNVSAGNGVVTGSGVSFGFRGIHVLQGTGGTTFGTAGSDVITTASDLVSETWTITGNDAGTISNGGTALAFAGVANLIGGQANNTFAFQAGTNIFGSVAGGSTGTNTLDDSLFGFTFVGLQGQSVNNVRNGINFGISGFTTFIGGYAGSTLNGFHANSNWTITGDGNGTVIAGNNSITFKQFDSLTGDSLNDTFTMSAANGTQGLLRGHAWGAFGNLTTMPNNGNNAGGHDVLAYDSAFTSFGGGTPVNIDLTAGTATNILGGIISIDAISIAGSNNTLVGGNVPNTWVINDHNAGTLNGVGFSGIQNLLGGNDTDLFNFTTVGGHSGSVDGTINGAGGNNTLSYSGYVPFVSVSLEHNSATNIDGGANNGFSNIGTFVGGANAELVGKNENSVWTFFANGSGNVANAPNAPVYNVPFSGFATLHGGSGDDQFNSQNDTLGVAINGGAGNNTLSFAAVATPVTVQLGNTANGVTNIQTLVGGSSGADTLIGDPSIPIPKGAGGHYLWHLRAPGNDSFVTDQAADDTIFFRSFENLTGSTDDDTFSFGPNSAVSGTLNGGGGNNTLDFGTDNYGVPITLDLACGIVYQSANIAITPVNDLIASTFNKLIGSGIAGVGGDEIIGANVANAWSIIGPDAGIIVYSSTSFTFTGVSLLVGGDDSDIFTFATGSQITGTIDGGLGNNTLDYHGYGSPVVVNLEHSSATHVFSGANNGFSNIQNLIGSGILGANGDALFGDTGDQTWTLAANSTDTGNVAGGPVFTFAGVANLIGNSGNDTFAFEQNSALSGHLDGGNGTNTMDFSAYGAHVNVNFANHSATPIANDGANGFANISRIIGTNGSAPNDTSLAGPNASNLWLITSDNAGTLTSNDGVNPPSTITFSGVADLIGNFRDDYFAFSNDANVESVNGGTGENIVGGNDQGQFIDTVDYFNLTNTTSKLVNLNNFVNLEQLIGTPTNNDTLQGSNQNTFWQVTGINTGMLAYADGFGFHAPSFSHYGSLTGGTANNTFSFTEFGFLSGQVTGGALTGQALDFSTYGAALDESISDLSNGTTGSGNISVHNSPVVPIAGGFVNIQHLAGSGITGPDGDQLTGPPGDRTWNLTGPDSGSVSDGIGGASLAFSGIANLFGGTGDNTFSFHTGGSLSGFLTGDSGFDTLDYTSYAGDVTVDLESHAATAIAGGSTDGFFGFEALKGANGRTTLLGTNANTTWNITGTGAGDLTVGLGIFAFSAVDDITGGSRSDQFLFGPNGSIPEAVIGGPSNGTFPFGVDFNFLDYSGYGSASTTNLQNHTSTAVGSFSNIGALTGDNTFEGTLIGADSANNWDITDDDFGFVNGFGFNQIANLTGGAASNSFMIEPGASLSGTITAHGTTSLTVVNSGNGGGGSFVLSDTSVSYGGNVTSLAGTFATATIAATSGSAHTFNVSGWTSANGQVYLNGGAGIDTVIAATSNDMELFNDFLQYNNVTRFFLRSIEAAALTNTDSSHGHTFSIGGWSGTRTAVLDGGVAGGNIDAFGSFGFTLSEGSLIRTTGGNVTFTNLHRVSLADFGGGHLLTINGWLGTGDILGTASDTLVNNAPGNITLTNSHLSTAAGLNALNLSGISKAVIQTTDANGVTINASGFSGSATLAGGAGADVLTAGTGNSILLGGAGNDTLNGGLGFNILVGGSGSDTLNGGSNVGTILIGGVLSSRYFTEGSTLTSAQLSALNAVMAEWSSGGTLTSRVQHLLNGGPVNGSNVLNSTTVFDDGSPDILNGDLGGNDWFLYSVGDTINQHGTNQQTLI